MWLPIMPHIVPIQFLLGDAAVRGRGGAIVGGKGCSPQLFQRVPVALRGRLIYAPISIVNAGKAVAALVRRRPFVFGLRRPDLSSSA
jgi:hypothetical protein